MGRKVYKSDLFCAVWSRRDVAVLNASPLPTVSQAPGMPKAPRNGTTAALVGSVAGPCNGKVPWRAMVKMHAASKALVPWLLRPLITSSKHKILLASDYEALSRTQNGL